MDALRKTARLEYSGAAPGTLRLFRSRPTLERAVATANRLVSEVFCVALGEKARNRGVRFLFETVASGLDSHSGRITGVRLLKGRLSADHYIIAAGSYSPPLAESSGIRLPVRPAKGYSLTFGPASHTEALRVPVVDDDWHAAVVPLRGLIRVAGTAEFAGYDRSLCPRRVQNLLSLAQRILPHAGLDLATATP
jgi:D-amino-acid dehydrogenase